MRQIWDDLYLPNISEMPSVLIHDKVFFSKGYVFCTSKKLQPNSKELRGNIKMAIINSSVSQTATELGSWILLVASFKNNSLVHEFPLLASPFWFSFTFSFPSSSLWSLLQLNQSFSWCSRNSREKSCFSSRMKTLDIPWDLSHQSATSHLAQTLNDVIAENWALEWNMTLFNS